MGITALPTSESPLERSLYSGLLRKKRSLQFWDSRLYPPRAPARIVCGRNLTVRQKTQMWAEYYPGLTMGSVEYRWRGKPGLSIAEYGLGAKIDERPNWEIAGEEDELGRGTGPGKHGKSV